METVDSKIKILLFLQTWPSFARVKIAQHDDAHAHYPHFCLTYKGKKSSLITYLSLIKAKWWGMLSDSHVKLFVLRFTTSSIYLRYPLQLLGFWIFTQQQNCKFLERGNKGKYNSVHFYLTIYHVPFKFIRYLWIFISIF